MRVWEDTALPQLHRILQIVMGWEDCHLHEFRIGRLLYGVPDPEANFGRKVRDERRVRLSALAERVGTGFTYVYDFGDDWRHDVLLEAIRLPGAGANYPQCVEGRRSGPPEDAGGGSGYNRYLSALADPQDKDHEAMLMWRGPFDPEAFSAQRINEELRKKIRSRPRPTPLALERPGGAMAREAPPLDLQNCARPMQSLLQRPPWRVPARKRIRPDERVPIELSERERELIVGHSFAGEELTRRLLVVPPRDRAPVYYYTLEDLDELAGYVAAEANHARNAKLRREWNRIFSRIEALLETYTDEEG